MSALAPACVTMPGIRTAVAAQDRAVGTVVRGFVIERRLATHALHVNNGRLAFNGDGFLEIANP